MLSSFAYYLMELQKGFVDYSTKRLQAVNVTQGQLFFVLYVGKHPNCSPKELAQAIHVDGGHAARTIHKLIENDILCQSVNEQDHRAHVLCLTKQGEKVFQIAHEVFEEWDAQILKDLSSKEKEALKETLASLWKHQK